MLISSWLTSLLICIQCMACIHSFTPSLRSKLHYKVTDDVAESAAVAIPPPRWNCPVHEDVCLQTGVTLSRYMREMARLNPELEEIESIFTSLQVACKTLSNLVRKSALTGLQGLQNGGGSVNIQGEEQKKLDVIANDVLKQTLRWTGKLATLASEEEDAPVQGPYGNPYAPSRKRRQVCCGV